MSEIISTESFDPNASHSRIIRAETLEKFAEFQWYMGELRKREAVLVSHCCDISLSVEDRNNAAHRLAGLRESINFVREEREAAEKHLKEEIRREDPETPKKRPVLS